MKKSSMAVFLSLCLLAGGFFTEKTYADSNFSGDWIKQGDAWYFYLAPNTPLEKSGSATMETATISDRAAGWLPENTSIRKTRPSIFLMRTEDFWKMNLRRTVSFT